MTRILQTSKKYCAIYISIAIGALVLVLFLRYTAAKHQAYVIAGDKHIAVTIADTQAEREQGLSDTPSLAPGTGKLFIFDKPDTYGFWMKDMNYPLDMVWIDSNWKIVDISSPVSPDSYPAVIRPSAPAQYVLEINADEASVDNLAVGTELTFQK